MNENSLKTLSAAIAGKRVSMTFEEARDYALRAKKWIDERGKAPEITSNDAWERKLAEGVQAFKHHLQKRAEVLTEAKICNSSAPSEKPSKKNPKKSCLPFKSESLLGLKKFSFGLKSMDVFQMILLNKTSLSVCTPSDLNALNKMLICGRG